MTFCSDGKSRYRPKPTAAQTMCIVDERGAVLRLDDTNLRRRCDCPPGGNGGSGKFGEWKCSQLQEDSFAPSCRMLAEPADRGRDDFGLRDAGQLVTCPADGDQRRVPTGAADLVDGGH